MRVPIRYFLALGLGYSLLLASSVSAQAPLDLTGFVRDSGTALPIPSAEIAVLQGSRLTLSHPDGRYRLTLQPGTYRVVASSIGYSPDTVTITVEAGSAPRHDFLLLPSAVEIRGLTVFADGVARRVQEMAETRRERRKALENYSVTVHRLGFAYELGPASVADNDASALEGTSDSGVGFDTTDAVAFSERVIRQIFVTPGTYAEHYVARRASDNFFSEYEIFSSGGRPLDLNDESVDLNLLSEIISVVGPISQKAPGSYDLEEQPADSTWPPGTTEIVVTPKSSRTPQFSGSVFIEEETQQVIGMDLELSDAANISNFIFSLSDFRYQQRYRLVEGYWLPAQTTIEARLGMIGFGRDFFYRERWSYHDYLINQVGLTRGTVPLSGSIVEDGADSRDEEYWTQTAGAYVDEEERQDLEAAQAYVEERFAVKMFSSAIRTWSRAPTFLATSYLTNISDVYRFNRVEGHYVGIGIRTPATHKEFAYKGSIGRAINAGDWRYYAEARQTVPGTPFAIEGGVYKKLAIQFGDYRYDVGPLNVDEFRFTLAAALTGDDPRNYFEREGFWLGVKYGFGQENFIRAGYIREDQNFLPIVTRRSLFTSHEIGGRIDPNLNPRVGETPVRPAGGLEGFTEGEFAGFDFQFHYDNRQYRQTGLVRNYLIRQLGWYTDHLVYWSNPSFGSANEEIFQFVKYRSTAGVRVPMFASHFITAELFVAGANDPLPAQMQFSNNGFYFEDFLRRRPLLTMRFNEGIGNRVTTAKLEYNLGSAFSRWLPTRFLRESGMQLRVWGGVGLRHAEAELTPVTPWTDGRDDHVEVGAGLTRLLGMFSFKIAVRVKGNTGDKIGIMFIF